MKLNVNNKLLMTVFVIALSIALIARDVLSVYVNKFILLGICTAFLFVADETTKISMISFLIPLMCGLPSTYIMLIILALLVMKNRLRPITVMLFVFFSVLEIGAVAFISVSFGSTLIKQILFICVFFAMLYTVEKINYMECMLMYFLGTILVCLVIDVYSIMRAPSDWLTLFSKGWYRFGSVALEDVEGMTLRLNPNSLAYFSLSGLLVGLILIGRTRGILQYFYLIGVCFLLVSGFMSVSRAWILVTAGCIGLLMISIMANPRRIILVLILIASLIVGTLVMQSYFPEVIEGMITRMTSSTLEGANGRTDLFNVYVDALLSNVRFLLMGTGATHYKLLITAENSVHNGTVQIFMSYGIIGGSIFIGAMLYPLIHNERNMREKLVNWLPFIGIVLFAQTIQFINPCYLMMPYVIAVYAIKEGRVYRQK